LLVASCQFSVEQQQQQQQQRQRQEQRTKQAKARAKAKAKAIAMRRFFAALRMTSEQEGRQVSRKDDK
jgi:hypothetical protein